MVENNGRGRPKKGLKGQADWFRCVVGERNELYIKRFRGKFGQVKGYGICLMLWELFLSNEDWKLDLEDLDFYALEIGIKKKELKEFIDFGIKKDIFQKNKNEIRFAELEKRMKYLVNSRKYQKQKYEEYQSKEKQKKKNSNSKEKNSKRKEQHSIEEESLEKDFSSIEKEYSSIEKNKVKSNGGVVDVVFSKRLKDFLKTKHNINPNKKTGKFMEFILANCPDKKPVEFTKFLIQSEFVKSKGTKAGGKVIGLSDLVNNTKEFNRLKDQYINKEKTAAEKQQRKLAREKKEAERKQKSEQAEKIIRNDPELLKQFKEEKYIQKYPNVLNAYLKFAEDKGLDLSQK